jgi:leucyl aminopeptidase
VTFDTGGLCLKPEQYMTDMKNDMTGAAMASHICFLAAELQLNVRVTALVGLAENLLDGNGMRPSDVYTSRSGKTVEISDTDAEGRLLLADMLHYASELKPAAIIDMATLTGAAVAALGEKITTVLTNSDDLWQSIEFAAKEADEKMWRLPLEEAYSDALKSKVADLKNYGKGPGAITAGLFLKEFVGEGIKWAHFDLSACGETADAPTAAGTLTILKLLSHL